MKGVITGMVEELASQTPLKPQFLVVDERPVKSVSGGVAVTLIFNAACH